MTYSEEEYNAILAVCRSYKNDYDSAFERLKSQQREIERLKAENKQLKTECALLDDELRIARQDTIDVLNKLKAENEELSKVVSSKVYDFIDNTKEIADAREAWEQQAKIEVLNELKEKCKFDGHTVAVYKNDIDEMMTEVLNAKNKG